MLLSAAPENQTQQCMSLKKNKKLLNCEQLQFEAHAAIALSLSVGKKPSFRILRMFQKEAKVTAPKLRRKQMTTSSISVSIAPPPSQNPMLGCCTFESRM